MQSVMLVFLTQLCKLLSLAPSLWFNSPPLPGVNKYTKYTYIVCKGEGYEVLGLRQINNCRKVHLQVNFFRWRHFALPSMSLLFLRPYPTPPPSNEQYPGPHSVKFNTNVYLLLRRRCPNTLNYHESMGYIPHAPFPIPLLATFRHSPSLPIPSSSLHSVIHPFRHPLPILSSSPPAVLCPICHPHPVPSSSSLSAILYPFRHQFCHPTSNPSFFLHSIIPLIPHHLLPFFIL